jgi:hypothetical protein
VRTARCVAGDMLRGPAARGGVATVLAQGQVRSDKTPKSPIPVPPFPDVAGKRPGGGIPVSRFGRNRERGNPRFPLAIRPGSSAGTGNGAPIWPKSGNRGYSSHVRT